MVNDYRFQAARLANLKRCVSIITASEHMRLEYLKHGFTCPIYTLPIPADGPAGDFCGSSSGRGKLDKEGLGVNLLFVGRMVFEKGGVILLQALPLLANAFGMKVNLCMVGDGPDKPSWVEHASKLTTKDHRVSVQFYGWCGRDVLNGAFDGADLLVVPSVWPEPFGMVGFEAGIRGLPAAGFAVGGIGEWLWDGINGHLASPAGDRVQSLADAIVECLRSPDHYLGLRNGAREMAVRVTIDQHATQLIEILEKSCGESRLS
jgi:glycosyltransferase involved in cell wall biosynthesis